MRRWTSIAACGVILTLGAYPGGVPASAAPPDNPVPVEGQSSEDGAPLLRAEPGWYESTAPDSEQELHYQVKRTTPRTDLHVGLVSRPTEHLDDAFLHIELSTLDGVTCDSDTTWSSIAEEPRSLMDASVSDAAAFEDEDAAKKCAQADHFVVVVSQNSPGNDDFAGTEMELAVNQEPRATNRSDLPKAVDDNAEWVPLSSSNRARIDGARHPFDAEPLEPGSYESTIADGQQLFFRIDLDWGERLQAHVRVPRPPAKTRNAIERRDRQQLLVGQLLSPTFGNPRVRDASVEEGFNHADLSESESSELRVHTNEVRYRNRSVEDSRSTRKASVAGPYYLIVTLPDSRQDYELPIELELATRGQRDDPPEYAQDVEAIGPGWADTDEVDLLAGWLVGGGLLLALAGAGTLVGSNRLARRRNRAAQPNLPPAPPASTVGS